MTMLMLMMMQPNGSLIVGKFIHTSGSVSVWTTCCGRYLSSKVTQRELELARSRGMTINWLYMLLWALMQWAAAAGPCSAILCFCFTSSVSCESWSIIRTNDNPVSMSVNANDLIAADLETFLWLTVLGPKAFESFKVQIGISLSLRLLNFSLSALEQQQRRRVIGQVFVIRCTCAKARGIESTSMRLREERAKEQVSHVNFPGLKSFDIVNV